MTRFSYIVNLWSWFMTIYSTLLNNLWVQILTSTFKQYVQLTVDLYQSFYTVYSSCELKKSLGQMRFMLEATSTSPLNPTKFALNTVSIQINTKGSAHIPFSHNNGWWQLNYILKLLLRVCANDEALRGRVSCILRLIFVLWSLIFLALFCVLSGL